MEYQQHYNQQQHHHHQLHPGQSQIGLPDASSSSEKALMWGGPAQYMPASGYSTQAPSISGSIDPFGQQDQMDNTMSQCGMDTTATVSSSGTVQNDWNYNKSIQQQPSVQYQQQVTDWLVLKNEFSCML